MDIKPKFQLTENFYLKEFKCKSGQEIPSIYFNNCFKLACQLQYLRDAIKCPIIINSGYRTSAHNKIIGGAPHSQHLQAKAADIRTQFYKPHQLAEIVEKMIKERLIDIKGIGIYDTFIHLDIRDKPARWDLRTNH